MMQRRLCNVRPEEKISAVEIRSKLKLNSIHECLQDRRLQWFGLLEWIEENVEPSRLVIIFSEITWEDMELGNLKWSERGKRKSARTYNLGQKILKLFDVVVSVWFATCKLVLDIYYKINCLWVASQVAK